MSYVRECRITPSDTCAAEGKVCAPYPDPDFSTCIHHTGEVDCPIEYTAHEDVISVEGDKPFVFTLCCMVAPRSPT